jgi:hypothetical protein
MEEIRDRPVAELLTRSGKRPWPSWPTASSPTPWAGAGFERAVRDYLERTGERLLQPDRTFEQLLPVGLVAAVEKGIAGYLPLAIERLAAMLEDPDAREKLRGVLHRLLERFLQDLNFYKRVVAASSFRPTPWSASSGPWRRRAPRTSPSSSTTTPSATPWPGASTTPSWTSSAAPWSASWAARATRAWSRPRTPSPAGCSPWPATPAPALPRGQAPGHAGRRRGRTWGELLGRIPPEKIAWPSSVPARSDEARARCTGTWPSAGSRLVLERPIGRPADLLGDGPPTASAGAVGSRSGAGSRTRSRPWPGAWTSPGRWSRRSWSTPWRRSRSWCGGVTERELQLIVYLGYVLGAIIGLSLVTLQADHLTGLGRRPGLQVVVLPDPTAGIVVQRHGAAAS